MPDGICALWVRARPTWSAGQTTDGVFSENRNRLLSTEMSRKVMTAILAHREVKPPLSDDHCAADGTLVNA